MAIFDGYFGKREFLVETFLWQPIIFYPCQNFGGTLEMKKNKVDICYAFSNLQFRFLNFN